MKPLTKEERAAKFAVPKKDVGLRSRGHRKLTVPEQHSLYASLSNESPEARLLHLRILREAVQSTDSANSEFETKVYEASVRESIRQRRTEALQHMLARLVRITDKPVWSTLFVVCLSNANNFHEAYNWCSRQTDWQYVSSVVNKDMPQWELLLAEESEPLVQTLMREIEKEFEGIKLKLAIACKHPRS